MSRPNPANPIGPLMQAKAEMVELTDNQLLELENDLKSKVKRADGLNEERVKLVFSVISEEKKRRNL